jgi:hypothetical protein
MILNSKLTIISKGVALLIIDSKAPILPQTTVGTIVKKNASPNGTRITNYISNSVYFLTLRYIAIRAQDTTKPIGFIC